MTTEHNILTGAALHNSKLLLFSGPPASYTPPESGIIVCCITSPNVGKLYRTTGTTAGAVTLLAAGADGTAATLSVGTVTATSGSTAGAVVSNAGTSAAAVLNFDFTLVPGTGYGGTSNTSLAVASSGSKSITTQAGLAYVVGSRVRLASSASPSNYMEGVVTSYSSTTLVFTADLAGGSGTITTWNLSLAGDRGATGATGSTGSTGSTGAAGAGYGGTSPTSLAVASSGSQSVTTQAGLAYVVGSRVRLASSASPGNYMEGLVTSYSSTTLVFTADLSGGSGTFASWNLTLAGDRGTTGATGSTGSTGATGSVSSAASLIMAHIATPSAPSAGNTAVYAKSDNLLYYRPAGGSETVVGSGAGGRTALTGNLTLYVRTDGNDSNTGTANTSGSAFLTWQAAVNAYASRYDQQGFDVTIQAGQGAVTFNVSASLVLKKAVGPGDLILDFNGATFQSSGALADNGANQRALIEIASIPGVTVKGAILIHTNASTNASWNVAIRSQLNAALTLDGNTFGALTSSASGFSHHIMAEGGGTIFIPTNYTISGGAGASNSNARHYYSRVDGLISVDDSRVVTITGTPKFNTICQVVGGTWQGYQVTFPGTLTTGAKKHDVTANGKILTYDNNPTTAFPGSVSGTTATGGQFI